MNMPQERKLDSPITLFASIEQHHHAALRRIAFEQHRSMADVVREAISEYIAKQEKSKSSPELLRRRR